MSVSAELEEKLHKIRSSPKLENQQQNSVVLAVVEECLRDTNQACTPTGYFAVLLAMLKDQYTENRAKAANPTAVTYLLDLVAPYVPQSMLRQSFGRTAGCLTQALSDEKADGSILRSAIGCLVTLLKAQDSQAWAIPQTQQGPRSALATLLSLGFDQRPKVRKRAQQGLASVLSNPPPGPSVEHPAAAMCAETVIQTFENLATNFMHNKQSPNQKVNESTILHAMQMIKTVATASNGWPSRSIESLVETLLVLAKSKGTFLVTKAFEVFETILQGMSDDEGKARLLRLIDAIIELQPPSADTQTIPPWLAAVSRAFGVLAEVEPMEAFTALPRNLDMLAPLLASNAYNIRVSASECLISLCVNCISPNAILNPSPQELSIFREISEKATDFLSFKYQASWPEVFELIGTIFECLRWQADPYMKKALSIIGELRSNTAFQGKDKADEVIKKAVSAMGPEATLEVLPLNLVNPGPDRPGRAWMLPLLRDSVKNTKLGHFKKEFVPLSERLYARIMNDTGPNKTTETKIMETVVNQIWDCLPGYCERPLDVDTAFDLQFAEMLANLLYQQPEMRLNLFKSLQELAECFLAISNLGNEDDLLRQGRITRAKATADLAHLATFASNLLAVFFNVYCETPSSQRDAFLPCIDAWLGVIKHEELVETFIRVAASLEQLLQNSSSAEAPAKDSQLSHALMDLVVVIAGYLPRDSLSDLFKLAAVIIGQPTESQLQKKAYKIIPRLSASEGGQTALRDRSQELCDLIISTTETVQPPARRDRLHAISQIIETLPPTKLFFIPCVLPEAILCTKETNERARETAFDLLVQMGRRMQEGGEIDTSQVPSMQSQNDKIPASIEEFFTMLSAGLGGATPHMISASVTAISRALYQFHAEISDDTILNIVSTMEIFLTSPTREVVRSVLGFFKVCVLSLKPELIIPRLPTLIPSLISWSHEHKAHFRSKVKSILERMIKKYGFDVVERHCPEEDKRLVINIRKTRDRRKKKRETGGDADAMDVDDADNSARAKFDNEFDEAVYGSDEDGSSDSDTGGRKHSNSDQADKRSRNKGHNSQAFIQEDADDPLDLLSRKALGNISSARPAKPSTQKKPIGMKAKKNEDGKLIINEDDSADESDDDGDDVAEPQAGVSKSDEDLLKDGINAYVDAIRSKDAPRRGQRGRLKFSNRPSKTGEDVEDETADTPMKGPKTRGTANRISKTPSPRAKTHRRPLGGRTQGRGMTNGRGRRGGFRGKFNRHT